MFPSEFKRSRPRSWTGVDTVQQRGAERCARRCVLAHLGELAGVQAAGGQVAGAVGNELVEADLSVLRCGQG